MSDPKELRELVFAAIVNEANANPTFKKVMDQLGFFTAVGFIDGICNALTAAGVEPAAERTP